MKTKLTLVCAAFIGTLGLGEPPEKISEVPYNLSLAVELCGFYPLEKQVCNTYRSVMPDLSVSLNVPLSKPCRGWVGVDYIWSTGHSLGYSDATSIKIMPVSLGIEYLLPLNLSQTEVFFGVGALYSFLWLKNDSPYVRQREAKSTLGGLVQVDLLYKWNESISLGGVFSYVYQRFCSSDADALTYVEQHSVDLSGIKMGLDLSIAL